MDFRGVRPLIVVESCRKAFAELKSLGVGFKLSLISTHEEMRSAHALDESLEI